MNRRAFIKGLAALGIVGPIALKAKLPPKGITPPICAFVEIHPGTWGVNPEWLSAPYEVAWIWPNPLRPEIMTERLPVRFRDQESAKFWMEWASTNAKKFKIGAKFGKPGLCRNETLIDATSCGG
jgi:hypothetical protein